MVINKKKTFLNGNKSVDPFLEALEAIDFSFDAEFLRLDDLEKLNSEDWFLINLRLKITNSKYESEEKHMIQKSSAGCPIHTRLHFIFRSNQCYWFTTSNDAVETSGKGSTRNQTHAERFPDLKTIDRQLNRNIIQIWISVFNTVKLDTLYWCTVDELVL